MLTVLSVLLICCPFASALATTTSPLTTGSIHAYDAAPNTSEVTLGVGFAGTGKAAVAAWSHSASVGEVRAGFSSSVAAEDSSGIIYRTGSRTPNALTDSSGVSFRDSVSSSTSTENPQVFHPGDKIWGVDTAKLPPGSVVRDGVPAGHVSVFATPEEITAAIIDEFGAYRIPR